MRRLKRLGLYLVSLIALGTGFVAAVRLWRRRQRDFRLFILEYHDVSSNSLEPEGTISQERFRRHLRFLKRRYRLTTLSRAVPRLRAKEGLTEDLLVVTLDDGYAGNYEAAWPILAAEGVPATIFVTTGFLDGGELWFDFALRALTAATRQEPDISKELRQTLVEVFGRWPYDRPPRASVERVKKLPQAARERLLEALRRADLPLQPTARPLSWAQVREMQDGGLEIGGHTVSHPILPSLPPALQESEILGCRQRILEETGKAPVSFAFPNGDYDADTVELVHRLGFEAACTTRRGSNRPRSDPFTLRRIGVGSDPTWALAARLSGLFDEGTRRWLGRGARQDGD